MSSTEHTPWPPPLVVESDGRAQVVTSATGLIRSYDAATGDLIWECDGMTMNAIPSPVSTKGLIFVMSGFRGNALLAIRLAEAKGNITGSGAIVWRHDLEDSFHATPVIVGKDLYLRGFDHLYCIAED